MLLQPRLITGFALFEGGNTQYKRTDPTLQLESTRPEPTDDLPAVSEGLIAVRWVSVSGCVLLSQFDLLLITN